MNAVQWAHPPGIPRDRGTVATVGTFDGVHLGHWTVLQEIRDRAEAAGRRAVLVTFDPHPLRIVRPETVIAWHRRGWRLYWTWRSKRRKPGRPPVPQDVRDLIRTLSSENPWGAPRVYGELLKLGIDVSQATVAKYVVRREKPPSQNWRTFLDNHVTTLASIDFFAVPTIRFGVLHAFLVLAHDRRRVVHFHVTANPTAEWTARQMTEAFPGDSAPRYMLRDRDGVYGRTWRE